MKLQSLSNGLLMKLAILALIIVVIIVVIRNMAAVPFTQQHWMVYYNQLTPVPPTLMDDWDLIVVDNDAHPDVRNVKNGHGNTIKLAYISIGEIAEYRIDYNDFKNANVFLGLKKGMTNVHVTDIRKEEFYPLIKKQIEKAKFQGFDGVMLDTLDTTIALGRADEIGFALDGITQPMPGMNDAIVKLIKQMRSDFPEMKIMVNRAFDVTPAISRYINYIIAESTITDTLPDGNHVYHNADTQAIYDNIRAMLKETHLPVYAIDYWDLTDTEGVKKLYAEQRAMGFCPYVSEQTLQSIHREPY